MMRSPVTIARADTKENTGAYKLLIRQADASFLHITLRSDRAAFPDRPEYARCGCPRSPRCLCAWHQRRHGRKDG